MVYGVRADYIGTAPVRCMVYALWSAVAVCDWFRLQCTVYGLCWSLVYGLCWSLVCGRESLFTGHWSMMQVIGLWCRALVYGAGHWSMVQGIGLWCRALVYGAGHWSMVPL